MMTRSSDQRRKRRAVKGASKKHAAAIAKNNGVDISAEVALDPMVQGAKIAALEKAVGQLVHMSEQNHQSFLRAFQLSDAHLWVLRQLCKDIVAGSVMMSESEAPAVNMEMYYDLFNAAQKQQAEEAAKKKALEEAGVTPTEDGPAVFGGDMADGASP